MLKIEENRGIMLLGGVFIIVGLLPLIRPHYLWWEGSPALVGVTMVIWARYRLNKQKVDKKRPPTF